MTLDGTQWDVIVIGGGPSGAMAALAAAEAGARTLLLERSELPRHKLCGGGLIGASLASLPAGFTVPGRDSSTSATFSVENVRSTTRTSARPFITMIDRSEFDAQLVAAAQAAGATIVTSVTLEQVEQDDSLVSVRTSAGRLSTRALVGADGSASRVATYVGARYSQVDLGLEVELDLPEALRHEWSGRMQLDFGDFPGSYAWVFPKGDRLTVGAIAERGNSAWQRQYLDRFIDELGLSTLTVQRGGGHLTRCRAEESPLAKGRVLLCGDAAGLLEPWTREGISFALRSGRMAGGAAARIGLGSDTASAAGVAYAASIASTLGAEMRAGATLYEVFKKHPVLAHRALASTRTGWRSFERLSRGETSLDRVMLRRPVRMALAMTGSR
jgi:geranylgeranyl reductase family protein